MVTRRLDADERSALGSGSVYAWEERGPHSEITGLGIERFTEGRRWSPSRVRDEFLFYYEKFVPLPETSSLSEKMSSRVWDPLVKQTYSVWVETERGRRKWHLTAYFTQATVDRLGTVDDIPGVRELIVPNGIFKSTRSSKNRNKSDEPGRPVDKPKLPSAATRTYAPFPSPALYPTSNPSQPNIAPSQEAPSSSLPYTDHLAYNQYYQTQVQSHLSEFFNQAFHTFGHEGAHVLPTIPTSQDHYLQQATPKHEIYTKAIDDSSQARYVSMPRNNPPPYTPARHPMELESTPESPTYARGPSIDSPLHPVTCSRGYEPTSDVHGAMSANTVDNQSYVYGLQAMQISDPTTHPLPYSRLDAYSDTDNQEGSPNLPPLHVVEGIQASVNAMATPSDALIPGEGRKPTVGPNRHLVPLHSLTRPCPYRREPLDDKTLRLLRPRD